MTVGSKRRGQYWIIRGLTLATVFVVLGAAIAGCSSRLRSQEDKKGTNKERKTPIKAKMYYSLGWFWGGYETILVAKEKGFFKREGLDVEWVDLPGEQYTAALDSGKLDFAPFSDYAYFINVYNKGVNAKEVVASTMPIWQSDAFQPSGGSTVIVPKNSNIEKLEDLKGKKLGTDNPEWSDTWFLFDFLRKKGITRDDLQYVTVPYTQQEQVLLSGGVDAMISFGEAAVKLLKEGKVRSLYNLTNLTGGRFVTRGGTMANGDVIKKNPEKVRRFVAAVAKANDWANKHPADVIKLAVEKGYVDPSSARVYYGDYSKLRWAEHGLQNEDDIKFWLGVDERQGVVPKGKFKASDFYTNEFNPYYNKK